MVSSVQHEDFYASGTYFLEQMGVYAGWTAHEESFAAEQVFFNRPLVVVEGELSYSLVPSDQPSTPGGNGLVAVTR